MIPEFPNFKGLELSDKEAIEKITSKFPPYSDFNFTSMWIWNTYQKMMISELNGNLVVLFYDYISGEKFFSFIGKNKLSETANVLLDFSKKNYKINYLKLIPEEIADMLSKSELKIISDRDSYDYIYSASHLSDMNNWSKNSSSKKIKQFMELYPDYKVKQSSINEILKKEYLEMFKRWANNKKIDNHPELNEYKAFERLLEIKDENIQIVSLYIQGLLAGFAVHEVLSGDYAISHFAKADINMNSSANDMLNWEEAKILNKQGIKYFNWEQDLGIPGLRYSKEKYKPSSFLNKYIISV